MMLAEKGFWLLIGKIACFEQLLNTGFCAEVQSVAAKEVVHIPLMPHTQVSPLRTP